MCVFCTSTTTPLRLSLRTRRASLEVAPLKARLFCRRRGASSGLSKTRTACNSPPSPCNMYIGQNFSVTLKQWLKMMHLVEDNRANGIVSTDFHPFHSMNKMSLSESAQKLRDVPNAGGNSVVSEVLSFEMLRNCAGAQLVKTEMEVEYFPEGGSITDYVCRVWGRMLAVSVTRAMKYQGDYTTEDANKLLMKKLNGVVQSSQNSMEGWSKQILHVWCTSKHVANIVTQAYDHIPEVVKSNTVVLITVAQNAAEVFMNEKKKK